MTISKETYKFLVELKDHPCTKVVNFSSDILARLRKEKIVESSTVPVDISIPQVCHTVYSITDIGEDTIRQYRRDNFRFRLTVVLMAVAAIAAVASIVLFLLLQSPKPQEILPK